MKLSRILNEHTIKPYYKNLLKTMSNKSVGEGVGEIWDFLTNVLSIEDMEVKTEIIHLYKKLNNYEEGDFDNLSDSDLSDIESLDDMDERRVALAKKLDVSPLVIEEYNNWGSHYGLQTYKDLTGGDVYAVGDDDEVEDAMMSYYEDYIDNMGGLDYVDRYLIEDYIELDDYLVEDFCDTEAHDRVDNMDEDEVIEEAGYDSRDSFQERLDDLEIEIDDLKSDLQDLEIELSDLDVEYDEEEMEGLQETIDDLEYRISEKESEYEDIESEMNGLYDTARDELVETYKEDLYDEIQSQGFDYFIDNLGYSLSDAVGSFGTFDSDGLQRYLAESEDRGGTLASYDGNEDWENINGTDYYIYMID